MEESDADRVAESLGPGAGDSSVSRVQGSTHTQESGLLGQHRQGHEGEVEDRHLHRQEGGTADRHFHRQEAVTAERYLHRQEGGTTDRHSLRQEAGTAERYLHRQEGGTSDRHSHRQEGGTAHRNLHSQEAGTADRHLHRPEGGVADRHSLRQEGGTADRHSLRQEGGTADRNLHRLEAGTSDRHLHRQGQEDGLVDRYLHRQGQEGGVLERHLHRHGPEGRVQERTGANPPAEGGGHHEADRGNIEVQQEKQKTQQDGNPRFERCYQGTSVQVEGGGHSVRPSTAPPTTMSPVVSPPPSNNMGRSVPSLPASPDGESDTEMAQLLNRTRQKKFVKYFKQLPCEELVLQRYSCALVGDILLQGHLYVTENYIAFHSNVFGYITRIQIPMISVTKITKEKTAKIIPNAVGVFTLEESHILSSLISREATFKVMTKAWKKALAKHNLSELNGAAELGEYLEDEEEGVEEEAGHLDEESTDSMVSASQLPSFGLSRPPDRDSRSPYLVKRMSNTNGALYYKTRISTPPPAPSPPKDGIPMGTGRMHSLIISVLDLPLHSLILFLLTLLLFLLLCTSLYLVSRLDSIQEKVEAFLPSYPSNFEQISSWQQILHSKSGLKVQEYLDNNLQQISQVRENLEKLSSLLHVKDKDEFQ